MGLQGGKKCGDMFSYLVWCIDKRDRACSISCCRKVEAEKQSTQSHQIAHQKSVCCRS